MEVSFVVDGALALVIDLPVNPDPQQIAASLAAQVTLCLQQRHELSNVASVYAVTFTSSNFGSQDELEPADTELDADTRIVVWAHAQRRRKVARKIDQVIALPGLDELVQRPRKRKRLADDEPIEFAPRQGSSMIEGY